MPGEVLDHPNPPPRKSQLPDFILEYHINLDYANALTPKELQAIAKFHRAADYIAAAMIFLKDNILMEKLHRGSSGLPVRILSKSGPADLHMQGERDICTERCTVQLEITF